MRRRVKYLKLSSSTGAIMSSEKRGEFRLVLYMVPEEPSRIKVRIWRRLRKLGGIYPRASVCLIPCMPEGESQLKDIVNEIRSVGKAVVLKVEPLSSIDEAQLLQWFKASLEREYEEILEECQEFLDEIERNIATGNMSAEEAEELEEMLNALKRWFDKVKARDWLGSEKRKTVNDMLLRCEEELLKFTEKAMDK